MSNDKENATPAPVEPKNHTLLELANTINGPHDQYKEVGSITATAELSGAEAEIALKDSIAKQAAHYLNTSDAQLAEKHPQLGIPLNSHEVEPTIYNSERLDRVRASAKQGYLPVGNLKEYLTSPDPELQAGSYEYMGRCGEPPNRGLGDF